MSHKQTKEFLTQAAADLADALEHITALEHNVLEYGQHKMRCIVRRAPMFDDLERQPDCDCGWFEIYAKLTGENTS